MVWPIRNNKMRITQILDVKPENPYVKTIFFRDELCASAKPGQFLMVWIPGVDEIPLSISSTCQDGTSSVTVAVVGEATKALTSMRPGDLIGVRGPFGRGFKVIGERALIVGGGTGMAPLMPLVDKLIERNVETIVINGAENSDKIIFLSRLEDLSRSGKISIHFVTEDGSYGAKGLATDVTKEVLGSLTKVDAIYACGPEGMIRKIYHLARARSIHMQASLERYMRCAIGICGSCVIGKYRVCRDGPVFTIEELRDVEDYLGLIKYNERGEKVQV